MPNRSLGTAQNANKDGLDPVSHRQIIHSLYPVQGILDGLTVAGEAGSRKYYVTAGSAVVEYPAGQSRIAHFEGGETNSVEKGDPTNPRIDVVWLKPNDPTTDDGSVDVEVGVTQGVAAANPTEPDIPSGALRLMGMRMPPVVDATATATATSSYTHAIPYAGSLGRLGENWMQNDSTFAGAVGVMQYEQPVGFYLQSPRLARFVFQCEASVAKNPARFGVAMQLDATDIPQAGTVLSIGTDSEYKMFAVTAPVARGYHTARLRTWLESGDSPKFRYAMGAGDKCGAVGRRFEIFDAGPTD